LKNKSLILSVLFFFCFAPAYANDRGIEGVGGTFRVLKGEHPSIGMISEKIYMDIFPAYYEVKAEFLFKNYSNFPVKVIMGFPESSHGDINLEGLKKTSGF
jgi:hypothetical protein